jgi:hypothetical protein
MDLQAVRFDFFLLVIGVGAVISLFALYVRFGEMPRKKQPEKLIRFK